MRVPTAIQAKASTAAAVKELVDRRTVQPLAASAAAAPSAMPLGFFAAGAFAAVLVCCATGSGATLAGLIGSATTASVRKGGTSNSCAEASSSGAYVDVLMVSGRTIAATASLAAAGVSI